MHCATQGFVLLIRPSADAPPPAHPSESTTATTLCGHLWRCRSPGKVCLFHLHHVCTPAPLQEVKSNITILLLQREHFSKLILVQIFELEMPATPVRQPHKIRCRLIFYHSQPPRRAAASCGDGARSESHACGNANANLWSTRKPQLFCCPSDIGLACLIVDRGASVQHGRKLGCIFPSWRRNTEDVPLC